MWDVSGGRRPDQCEALLQLLLFQESHLMAGYFLYTLDQAKIRQLTTEPTAEQARVLAEYLLEGFQDRIEDFDDPADAHLWPKDVNELTAFIQTRLAAPDWYSDFTLDSAYLWDEVVFSLQREPGERLGLELQCSDYESIYWDCAEMAAEQGATMLAEPKFGGGGFRYFGKPAAEYGGFPMYTWYLGEELRQLMGQLKAVEGYFTELPEDDMEDSGSPRVTVHQNHYRRWV